jgi:PAS domain S-box-containing protein
MRESDAEPSGGPRPDFGARTHPDSHPIAITRIEDGTDQRRTARVEDTHMSSLSDGSIGVLHVDADSDFTDQTATCLERECAAFEVTMAANASDGLDRLLEADVDCVVSGYDLPEMDGLEFSKAVRERQPDLPFLLFTDRSSEAVASDPIGSGAIDYLRKQRGTGQYELLADWIRSSTGRDRSHRHTSARTREDRESQTDPARRLERLHETIQRLERADTATEVAQITADSLEATLGPRDIVVRFVSDAGDTLEPVAASQRTNTHAVEPPTCPTGEGPVGRAYAEREPILSDAVQETDERCDRRDARAGLSLPIGEHGTVTICDAVGDTFDDSDVQLARTLATSAGSAIDRIESVRELDKHRQIIETIPDGVYALDEELRYSVVNEGMAEITGYSKAELVGSHISLVHDAEGVHSAKESRRKLRESDAPVTTQVTEQTYYSDDGTPHPCEVRFRALPGNDGFVGTAGVVRDITERAEHRRRYDALFNQTYQFTGLMDPDGTLLEANNTLLQFGGIDLEDVIGEYIWDTCWWEISAEAQERVREAVSRAAEGEFVRYEEQVKGAEGTATIDFSIKPVTDERGDVVLLILEGRNITEMQKREQAFQRQHDQLRTIVENAPVVLFALDEDGVFTLSKGQGLATLGLEDSELVGESILDLYAGTPIAADARRAIDGETVHEIAEVDDRVFETWYEPVESDRETGAQESEQQVVGVAIDVTERHRHEQTLETLHETTRRLMAAPTKQEVAETISEIARNTLDLPINGVFFHDAADDELVPAAVSPEARDLIGDPPTIEAGNGLAWEVFDTGDPRFVEDVHTSPDRYNPDTEIRDELYLPLGEYGILLAGSTTGGEIDDADMALSKILAANAETVLERTDHEQELARQNDRLEFLNSLLRHDVLNGMTVITGHANMLAGELDDEELHHVETIQSWADDIVELIERVRAMLDALSGQTEHDFGPTDLSACLTRELDRLRTTYPAVDIEADIPDEVCVRADEFLSDVLGNVLTNAVDHNDGDRPQIKVRVDASDENWVTLRIADNGPGVPDAMKKTIFKRDVTARESSSGSGFGLFFVETMITEYGGDIWVEDNTPTGAVFVIELLHP